MFELAYRDEKRNDGQYQALTIDVGDKFRFGQVVGVDECGVAKHCINNIKPYGIVVSRGNEGDENIIVLRIDESMIFRVPVLGKTESINNLVKGMRLSIDFEGLEVSSEDILPDESYIGVTIENTNSAHKEFDLICVSFKGIDSAYNEPPNQNCVVGVWRWNKKLTVPLDAFDECEPTQYQQAILEQKVKFKSAVESGLSDSGEYLAIKFEFSRGQDIPGGEYSEPYVYVYYGVDISNYDPSEDVGYMWPFYGSEGHKWDGGKDALREVDFGPKPQSVSKEFLKILYANAERQ